MNTTEKQGHQSGSGGERRETGQSSQRRQETGQGVHASPQHKEEQGTQKSGQQSGQHAGSREK
jgi:hypothetical protein